MLRKFAIIFLVITINSNLFAAESSKEKLIKPHFFVILRGLKGIKGD